MSYFNNTNPKKTQENNKLAREKIQFVLQTLFQIIKFEKKSDFAKIRSINLKNLRLQKC